MDMDKETYGAGYRPGTAALINLLQTQDVDEATNRWKRIKTQKATHLQVDIQTTADGCTELVLSLPSSAERAKAIISDRRDSLKKQGISKADFARVFYNRQPTQLCNILSGRAAAPRDFILIGLLMMEQVYNSTDVSHALMEVGHPGLFTRTYNREENIRNYVLGKMFDMISRETKDTPQNEVVWPQFANHVLKHLDLPTLAKHAGDPRMLTNEQMSEADAWLEEAERSCGHVNYMVHRRHLFERSGKTVQTLAALSCASYDSCNDLLKGEIPITLGRSVEEDGQDCSSTGTHSNRGRRDSLIWLGYALDCSLEQVNQMLEEANHALIYPPIEQMDDTAFIGIIRNTLQSAREQDDMLIYQPEKKARPIPDQSATALFPMGK